MKLLEKCNFILLALLVWALTVLYNGITDNKNAELRLCVNELPDTLKMPVLLNSWRFLTDNFMIQETFRQFMKKYNEGVM